MTDVRVGDKVRVTYEGVVSGLSAREFTLQPPGNEGWRVRSYFFTKEGALPGRTVEVLERAKPKVGDMVSGAELDALPDGTVLGGYSPGNMDIPTFMKRPGHLWVGGRGVELPRPRLATGRAYSSEEIGFAPRKILLLPPD